MEVKNKLSENALKVLEKRYFIKDTNGKPIEDWESLCNRVSFHIARAEKEENREKYCKLFYDMIHDLKFLPNSPTLFNAGTQLGTLSACFVLPIEDDMVSIFNAVKNTALVHQRGGGTGFDFSKLRPKGTVVKSTQGFSSGPLSFLAVFNQAADVITQGGKRHGANMGILRVDHPDVMEFIKVKQEDQKAFTNFNFSVAITEEFMEALLANADFTLRHDKTGPTKTIPAKDLWNAIIEGAWKCGDPGIIFIDTMNKYNPTPHLGHFEATNPCGEQVLLPNESCNLGSINLVEFVKNGRVDWQSLEETIRLAVRLLDDVIDVNFYIIPEIEEATKKTRKIGLGIMGFAHVLFLKGCPYNSDEALEKAKKIMKFVQEVSHDESEKLGKEKGIYPAYKIGPKRRNATTTTIAPTGSISIIAGVSSGIEPVFELEHTRTTGIQEKSGEKLELLVIDPIYKEAKESKKYSEKELKKIFVAAHEISVNWHLKMQAVFQAYTDNAVSKSINLSNSSTREDIDSAYRTAYTLGLKGITVYRDGSRDEQILTSVKKDIQPGRKKVEIPESQLRALIEEKSLSVEDLSDVFDCSSLTIRKRLKEYNIKPKKVRSKPIEVSGEMPARKRTIKTTLGNLHIMVSMDSDGDPLEVFLNVSKSGTELAAFLEALGRLISSMLRHNIPIETVVGQLEEIGGESTSYGGEGVPSRSIPDALAKSLKDMFMKDKTKAHTLSALFVNNCPDCGSPLKKEEGCSKCTNQSCGFSRCG